MPNKMLLHETFMQVLEEVRPEVLIQEQCHLDDNILHIQDVEYDLSQYKNIYLLGSGKAVVPMAKGVQKILAKYEPKTLLVGAYESKENLINTTYIQSTHPLPSYKSVEAARSLVKFMQSMDSNDLYIYLLSGGSSALIELLPEEITLKDLEKTTQIMLHHGMPIEAMNVVRKSLSLIKGGKLALQSKAKGCVFVLSDVLGNDLSVIGSAPLYYTKSNTIDPVEVLYCYEVFDKIPKNVQQFLRSSQNEQCYDTATQIKHFLIGSNETVLNHAKAIIETKGIQVKLLDFTISGDVKDVAQKLCEKTCKRHTVKTCYIAGGEATVVVEGSGQGGRNQHLALHFLNMLQGDEDITFLSAATDGVDGNSNAAGAIVDWHTHVEALAHGLNAKRYLEYFDSNTFFTQIDALLVSGPTHNNLLDIVMIIVEPRIQGEING